MNGPTATTYELHIKRFSPFRDIHHSFLYRTKLSEYNIVQWLMTDKITTFAWNKADVKLYLYNLDQALLVQSIIVTKLKLWELIKDPVNKVPYWVNPSKRGGVDGVFRGLAGLLRGISGGRSPREIPRSSPASPRKTQSIPTLLLGFTFYLKYDILVIILIFLNIDVGKKHISRLVSGICLSCHKNILSVALVLFCT